MRSTLTITRWTADDIPSQAGRTFIVTGANSGLGYVTTCELARRGAHVIMTARDRAKGERAIGELRARQPDGSLELRHLDLSDLESVKAFAASGWGIGSNELQGCHPERSEGGPVRYGPLHFVQGDTAVLDDLRKAR